VIAAWYDLDPAEQTLSDRDAAAADADFARMQSLGFNTVFLRYGGAQSVAQAARLAAAHLHCGVESSEAGAFIRVGAFPAGIRSPQRLARSLVDRAPAPIILLPAGIGQDTATRLDLLTRHVAAAGGRSLPARTSLRVGDLALIRVGVPAATPMDGPEVSSHERADGWLRQFHEELLKGRTGGLVIDRYRRRPGLGDGLVRSDADLPPRERAAVRRLTARAAAWCPRLAGATVGPLDCGRDLSVATAIFARHDRLCVLVYNADPQQFRRGTLPLPRRVEGRELERAVEIPPPAGGPGEVHRVHAAGLRIPIDLGPGDARLFELF